MRVPYFSIKNYRNIRYRIYNRNKRIGGFFVLEDPCLRHPPPYPTLEIPVLNPATH